MENVAAMSVANIPPAQAAIFTRTRTGQVFTRHQMAYVEGFTRMANELMKDVDSSWTMADSSPADNMLSYLRKNCALYVCLYHNGKTKELHGQSAKAARTEVEHHDLSEELTSLSVIVTDDTSTENNQLSVPLEVAETEAFKKYALESRTAVGTRDEQDIQIGCSLVLPEGRRLFHAFPEVVCVDGTHETNNEHRPLLTLSVKDSNGKVTVIVRCIACSETDHDRW